MSFTASASTACSTRWPASNNSALFARATASNPANATWSAAFARFCSFSSCCNRSTAPGSSPGNTDTRRIDAAVTSRNCWNVSSARRPHRNSRRCPPLNRSHVVRASWPMAPVRSTCVPPQADRSTCSISMRRSVPARADSFRSGSRFASSSVTKRIDTGRSRQMTAFASCSTRVSCAGVNSRSRSIVLDSEPRWKLTVRVENSCSITADSRCWPVCCCM